MYINLNGVEIPLKALCERNIVIQKSGIVVIVGKSYFKFLNHA